MRKFVSISMFFSFLAVGTSGVMMFFIEKPSFTQQMHPPHKLFGLLMATSGILHIYYNWKPLMKYFKERSGMALASVLFIALIVLYSIGLSKKIPIDMDAKIIKIYKESFGVRK